MEQVSFWSLPVDQLQQILTYVTLDELLSLSCCSKSIHRMIRHTYYLCYLKHYSIPLDHDHNLRHRTVVHNSFAHDGVHIGQRPCYLTVTQLTHCLHRFHHLRTLQLYHMGRMEDKFVSILNASFAKRTLLHLELHNVRILMDGGEKLQFPDNNLVYMELEGTLFCTYDTLKSFTNFRKLKVLKLSGCRRLVDGDVTDIVQRTNKYGTLQELRLEDCSKLVAPAVNCPSLQILSFSRCNLLRDLEFVTCQNLLEIDLSYCSLVDNRSFHNLISQNRRIQKLSLRGNTCVTCMDLKLDDLRQLDLTLCIGLETCRIDCKSLVSMEMGTCVKLDDLYLASESMKILDLSMLTISNLSIQAELLEVLLLSGCCKLNSIRKLSCPRLQELDICGTAINPKMIKVGKKTKIKSGGDVHDWTEQLYSGGGG